MTGTGAGATQTFVIPVHWVEPVSGSFLRLLIFALAAAVLAFAQPAGRKATLHPGLPTKAPISFQAIASEQVVRVRASADGVRWSDWARTGGEALAWFDSPQHWVEIDGNIEVELLLIDPGPSPSARAYAVTEPPMITREQWGCTPSACPAKDPSQYTTVTHLIVHHTADANTATDWAAVVRSIWVQHVMGNGWNDIGYNYLIDPNGVLYEGRAGGYGVLGAHFSGVNGGTMGVSLIGAYSEIPPTAKAIDTLQQLLAWHAQYWKIDPAGIAYHASSAQTLNNISGHRDGNYSKVGTTITECPGNDVYVLLPAIREAVRKLVAGECAVTLPERNRCIAPDTATLQINVSAAEGCSLSVDSTAGWLQASMSGKSVNVSVAANSGARRSGTVRVNGQQLDLVQAAPGEWPLPCVSYGAIVNAADYRLGPAPPNSIVSIFGSNFPANPKVTVNGNVATVFAAVPNQINALIPAGAQLGTTRLNVENSPDSLVSITEASPAIFAALPYAPVQRGGYIAVYLTGANTPNTAAATLGGRTVPLLYLGPAPGYPGLQQANVSIPADMATGAQTLVITVRGVPSNAAIVTVN